MYLHSGIRNFTLCVCSTLVTGVTVGFERTTYLVSEGNVVDVCVCSDGYASVLLIGFMDNTLGMFCSNFIGYITTLIITLSPSSET